MLRYTTYFLPILFFYQALIGEKGSTLIDQDLESLEQSAEKGNPYAEGFLALCYLHGDKGLNISHSDAQYFAKKSANQGHWLGEFVLGFLYSMPPLGPDEKRLAQHYLQVFREKDGTLIKLAAESDPIALYVLGELFTVEGLSPYISTDLEMAGKYFEISAESGYAPACLQLGLIKVYGVSGLTVSSNDTQQKEGIHQLEKAVQAKLPAGHHYLARCYLDGNGIPQDLEMAMIHFQAAADRGFGLSQLVMADFLRQGLVGSADLEKALEYARLASEKGIDGSEEKISVIEDSLYGKPSPKDLPDNSNGSLHKPSIELAKPVNAELSAVNNALSDESLISQKTTIILPPSYNRSGEKDMTADKSSISNPIPETEHAYNDSENATKQSGASLREEGKRLYWSQQGSSSLLEASKLFNLAAEMGDPESARYLGLMYLQGKGVKKDSNEAIKWFEIASQGGDAMAKRNLQSLKRIIRK